MQNSSFRSINQVKLIETVIFICFLAEEHKLLKMRLDTAGFDQTLTGYFSV